jgi:4-hydroxy 2-oxovalerate aldolase
MSKSLKILDCTFRDGGYYNKWDFNNSLVRKYLHAVDNANIDIIELGFRSLPKNIAAIKAYEKIGFKNKQTPCITITNRSQLTMVLDVK